MFVVLRHIKHHSMGTIGASSSHTMRTKPTPNAAPHGPAPEVWIGSDKPVDDVRVALPEKRRKNAVLALEYVVTASPEFFEKAPEKQWRSYLQDQVDMLKAYYGQENVVSAVLHLDEKTPHLAVQIVPLLDGKLNARAFVGGKQACRVLQDLAGEVGKPFGLRRGLAGSEAEHKDVKQWYAELAPAAGQARQVIASAAAQTKQIKAQLDDIEDQKAKLRIVRAQIKKQQEQLLIQQASLDARAEDFNMKFDALTSSQQLKAADVYQAEKTKKQQDAKRPEPPDEPASPAGPSGGPGRRPGPTRVRP